MSEPEKITALALADEFEEPMHFMKHPDGIKLANGIAVEAHAWSNESVSIRWKDGFIGTYPYTWTFAIWREENISWRA